MKIAAMTLMAAMVGVATEPNQPQQKLTVYLRDNATVPIVVRFQALELANQMFAAIGVSLDWHGGEPTGARPIGIELARGTPSDLLPGALAHAGVYEGVHVRVFYDRVERDFGPGVRAAGLAHVLVHEITHLLQGIDRHSDSGVMKAGWNEQDRLQMRVGTLPFTPQDILLIHLGMASRPQLTRQNK